MINPEKFNDAMNPVFRIIERQEALIMRLIDLLTYKGIINSEEYDKYLSNESIDELMKYIDKELEGKNNDE